MSASESRSGVVLGLAEEFLERYRRGERPSLKEYIDRHPELAGEIREVFPAMALMENIALADESLAGDATGPALATGAVPRQLGDYRLLREVGRGGMGIVYEAEQVSLGRHVALKVLPRKMFVEDAQRRRFEREARAAAKLHHTNIVPVFGVGEHDGMPYYVMQFIQGLGLDDVLDELKRVRGSASATATGGELRVSRKDVSAADVARSLMTGDFGEPKGRVESPPPGTSAADAPDGSGTNKLSDSFTLSSSVNLPGSGSAVSGGKGKKATYWQSVANIGVQVAEALEYAHKQGILHRDIKPSNLLLDTRGTVWVSDFGLARAENEEHLTQTGDIVGTLRYMPPEAFEGRSDKRGDIYSLGLTLYELLALKPAYEERDRHRLIKRVTTEEPARLDKLHRAIPRDLVTIVHKAIDREPARRYATAAELSADLQRFLDDEPIRARRVSAVERGWRWCRHHPGVASLTAALALLLVSLTGVSLFVAEHEVALRKQADEAKKQAETNLREADQQKKRAEANFAKARQAVDDYFTKVSESQLLQVPGMQPLRRDLLQSALVFYQDFLKERGDDPTLRGEVAAAFLRVGKIRSELDERGEAGRAYEQARGLYEALTKAAPEAVEWQHGLAQCYSGLGRYGDAIALWQKLVRPGQPRYQKELADAYHYRANNYKFANRVDEALQDYQQALAIREMLVRLNPDDPDARHDLGGTLNNLGVILTEKGRHADALVLYRRAAEHADAAFVRAPQVIRNGRFVALFQNNIAAIERQLGHEEAALAGYQRAVEIRQKLARDNPAVPSVYRDLLWAYHSLASYQRELKQAEPYERSLRLTREALDRFPSGGADALFELACARAEFSTFLGREKGPPTVEKRAEQKREADLAVETLRKALAAGFRDARQLRRREMNVLRGRDDFQSLQADLATRAAAAADKRDDSQSTMDSRHKAAQTEQLLRADLAASQHAIGLIQLDRGKVDEARKHLQQAVALRETLAKEGPKNAQFQADLTASRRVLELVILLLRARRLVAEKNAKEAELALAKIDEFHSDSSGLWKERGRLRFSLGQTEKAADDFRKAVQLLRDTDDATEAVTSEADKLFARLADETLGQRLTAALELDPGSLSKRWQRGDWHARHGRWREAAADYRIMLERWPMERSPDNAQLWLHVAPVLAAGDRDGYRWLRREALKRYGQTQDPTEAERIAKACLVLPEAGKETELAGQLADRAVALGKDHAFIRYFRFCKGLADYRRGNFRAAVERLDALLPTIASMPDVTALSHLVLAMAHHRQGQTKTAREHRAQGAKLLKQYLHDLSSFHMESYDYRHDWLIAWLLHGEAQTLIEGDKNKPTK